MRTLPRIVFTIALSLFCTSHAEGSPIELSFAITYYNPVVGPPDAFFQFSVFESATNEWPAGSPSGSGSLATGGGGLLPGVAHFSASLNVADLTQVYFSAYGGYFISPLMATNLFTAEPPTGHVSDLLVYGYGPPWISLTDLGPDGLSGDLWTFYGYPHQADGSFKEGTWEVTAAPEPASIFLLGTGIAATVVRLRRTKHT